MTDKVYIPCLIALTDEDMLCLEKDGDNININIRSEKLWCPPIHLNINDLIVELLKMSNVFEDVKP
jgi:hypothetical protein